MNSKILEEFKEELLQRKKQIARNMAGTYSELNDMQDMDPSDDGDYASLSIENNIDNAIMSQQKEELNEIELALGKIISGNFGICEMCEDDITIERLNVKNFARYCIACREIKEKEQRKRN